MSQQLDTTEMCPNVDPTSERTAQCRVCPKVKLTLSDSTACPSETGLIPQSKLELSQLAGEEDLSVLGTEKPCLLSTSQRSMKTLTHLKEMVGYSLTAVFSYWTLSVFLTIAFPETST